MPLDMGWEALCCVVSGEKTALCWSLSSAMSRRWLTAAAAGCHCSSAVLPSQPMLTLALMPPAGIGHCCFLMMSLPAGDTPRAG